jgi:transposase
MLTLQEIAILLVESLLGAVSQILDQVAALRKHMAALIARVEELSNENAALKAQLDQVHRRGHRQAAPFSKDQRQDHPKRPGRKAGQGRFSFRGPPDPAWATEPPVEVRFPDPEPLCPGCGQPLEVERIESASTTEIPPQPQPMVRFYRVQVYRCPCCGQRVRASHPELAPDQYGATAHRVAPRVMATAHVLHYGVGIPVRKVPTVLRVLTGVELNESAIVQDAQRRAAQGVGQEYQDLRRQIQTAAVIHTDDTGWRIGGVPGFLMTFETDTTTVYQIRYRHRNQEVREVIPRDHPGVMVTDRGTSYDAQEFAEVKQPKCLPHVLRSIDQVLKHQAGKAGWFGRRLKALLQEALALCHAFHDGTVNLAEYHRRVVELKAAVSDHLRPRTLSDPDNQRLLKELGWHHGRGNLVRFLDDPAIPPTNNAGERSLRPAVIARKVSQCSKTDRGAEAFSAFCSVIRTAMKQGRDAVEWLCGLFRRSQPRASPS